MNYIFVRSNSLSDNVTAKLTSSRSIDLFDVQSNNLSRPTPFEFLAMLNITYFNISSGNISYAHEGGRAHMHICNPSPPSTIQW
jgi:hypothetical protein